MKEGMAQGGMDPKKLDDLRASIASRRQELLRSVSQTRKDERELNKKYPAPAPAAPKAAKPKFFNADVVLPPSKRARKK
jgi:hypothetical protein